MVMSDSNADFLKDIRVIIERINILVSESIAYIKPEVDDIIKNNITDSKQIEAVLDILLDYAGISNDGLMLFKRLCRYYYSINPNITAGYVYACRDLYGSDERDENENQL